MEKIHCTTALPFILSSQSPPIWYWDLLLPHHVNICFNLYLVKFFYIYGEDPLHYCATIHSVITKSPDLVLGLIASSSCQHLFQFVLGEIFLYLWRRSTALLRYHSFCHHKVPRFGIGTYCFLIMSTFVSICTW